MKNPPKNFPTNKQSQGSWWYKINIQKSAVFLYTNNKLLGREINKTVPFTTAPKRIKYLGINLSKEVKDPYTKNYKTLMKEIRYK